MKDKKNQIVFVESIPNVMTYKIAKSLKNIGYYVILISFLDFKKESYRDGYNKMISLDLESFTINLKNGFSILKKSPSLIKKLLEVYKLTPYIVIGVATPLPLWLPALARFFCTKNKFIYFPYDVNIIRYLKKEDYFLAGIPKFELNFEKYLFKNSGGIIFKGNELFVTKKKINIKCPVIQFLPYCSKEFTVPINKNKLSKKDGKIHLVSVGHLHSKENEENQGTLSSAEDIKKIVNQCIHFHVYTNSQYETLKNSKEYRELLKNTYFHLHPTVCPSKIAEESSKYDFGCWFGDVDNSIFNPEWIETSMGNKMSTFIEAGIPFICKKNKLKFVNDLFKKYNICIGIEEDKIENLKEILNKFDKKKFLNGMKKARVDFNMENNIPRLERFFKKIRSI